MNCVKKDFKNMNYKLFLKGGVFLKPSLENIEVKKITLYDNDMINFYLTQKYLNKYKRLLKLVAVYFENDDVTEGDTHLVLTELTKLEALLLLGEYKEYISEAKLSEMLKELYNLGRKIKSKPIRRNFEPEFKNKSR